MSNFNDRPLVAGSIIGLRAFGVDGLGRLIGPQYPTVFTPGVNVGKCQPDSALTRMARQLSDIDIRLAYLRDHRMSRPPYGTGGYVGAGPAEDKPEKHEHVVGSAGCKCGYYAYFDGGNDFAKPDRVTAVVEGTGVCTVGSRGFRAEKMRLLALVIPRPVRGFNVGGGRRLSYFWTALLLLNIASTVRNGFAHDWWMMGFLAVCTVLAGFSLINGLTKPRVRFDLIRAHYPEVPVYRSRRAALKAHPLTPPEPPSPDSDPDFWTRAIR